jgi:hypothetical protein
MLIAQFLILDDSANASIVSHNRLPFGANSIVEMVEVGISLLIMLAVVAFFPGGRGAGVAGRNRLVLLVGTTLGIAAQCSLRFHGLDSHMWILVSGFVVVVLTVAFARIATSKRQIPH